MKLGENSTDAASFSDSASVDQNYLEKARYHIQAAISRLRRDLNTIAGKSLENGKLFQILFVNYSNLPNYILFL